MVDIPLWLYCAAFWWPSVDRTIRAKALQAVFGERLVHRATPDLRPRERATRVDAISSSPYDAWRIDERRGR
ncbi:hypothetical protein C27AD_16681 [Salinisphaera hydrothermalis C27AD]